MKAIPIAVLLSFVVILAVPSAHAQIPPELFSVSPSEFTVEDAPPLGEPYRLERKLVVRNGDNVMRTFILSVRPPLEGELRAGFDEIPNENWIVLMPAVIEIEENSSGTVDMILNIPRWENLTDQRWQASISVLRAALEPGEIVELELVVIAKLITTEELPPLPPAIPLSTIVIIAVGVGAAVVIIGAWVWWRRKARSIERRAFSRSWG